MAIVKYLFLFLILFSSAQSSKIRINKTNYYCVEESRTLCKGYEFFDKRNSSIVYGYAEVKISKDVKNSLNIYKSDYTRCLRNEKFLSLVMKNYHPSNTFCLYNYTDDSYGVQVIYTVNNMFRNCSQVSFQSVVDECHLTKTEIKIFLAIIIPIMVIASCIGALFHVFDVFVWELKWLHPEKEKKLDYDEV
jgi:hypothetical protein